MKLANVSGRAALITADGTAVDIERASDGVFGPDLPSVYERWAEFLDWSGTADWSCAPSQEFTEQSLGSPSPRPRQILAIGLNYSAHAAESGFEQPEKLPPVFTKFVSALTGPCTTVELPEGGHTDWEVELTVVIGKQGHRVAAADAWDHVAGVTAAQDLSERVTQLEGPAPQFGFGKSFPGFLPVGPYLVTPDELPDRDAVDLSCDIDGEVMQSGNTRDLIFPVAELIEGLSRVVTLYPGDLILTGTPDGIGAGRTPQRFLQDGEVLTSRIAGIGELRQTFVASKG